MRRLNLVTASYLLFVLFFGLMGFVLGVYGFLRVIAWDDPARGFRELGLALVMSIMCALAARELTNKVDDENGS